MGAPTAAAFARLVGLELSPEDSLTLAADPDLTRFFDQAFGVHPDAGAVANWVVNELSRVGKDHPLDALPFSGAELGALLELVADGSLTGTGAKEIFEVLVESGGDPSAIMAERGLARVSDTASLAPIVDRLIEENPGKADAYRGGKTGLLGFFMGAVMRETGGSADPKVVSALIAARLDGG